MEEFANKNKAQDAAKGTEQDISSVENAAEFMGTVCSEPETMDFGTSKKTTVRLAISEAATTKDGSPALDANGERIQNTEFIEVQGWGKTGDRLSDIAKPYTDYKAAREAGDTNARSPRMIVSGELREERWEKDNGQTGSKVVLVARNVSGMENTQGHFVNRVVLKGNLVKDSETIDFDGGGKVSKNSIAVNKQYEKKNGERVNEVSYFNMDAFGTVADSLKTTKKGDFIQVDGKLRMSTFQTQDGKTRTALKIVPLKVNIISRSKDRNAQKAFAPKRSAEKSEEYSR